MTEVESPPAESKPSVTNRQARWLGGIAFVAGVVMAVFDGFPWYAAEVSIINALLTGGAVMIGLPTARNSIEYFAPKK